MLDEGAVASFLNSALGFSHFAWVKYKKYFLDIFESSCADSSQFLNFSMRPPAFFSPHARKKWLLAQIQFDIIYLILLCIQFFSYFSFPDRPFVSWQPDCIYFIKLQHLILIGANMEICHFCADCILFLIFTYKLVG